MKAIKVNDDKSLSWEEHPQPELKADEVPLRFVPQQ